MTDSDETKPATGNDILDRYAVYWEKAASLLYLNKTVLFATLLEAGVTHIDVRFDGYGDSGQIEEIAVRREDIVLPMPKTQVATVRIDYHATEPRSEIVAIEDAIRSLCYDILEHSHSGWEINEGAFGDFHFDTVAGTITLEYNERIETSEYSEHQY